jgi:hypothetical protein
MDRYQFIALQIFLPFEDSNAYSNMEFVIIQKRKELIFLLQKNNRFMNSGITPFQVASAMFGHEKVMEIVEETLIRSSSSLVDTPLLNIVEALLSAVTEENIHLDCLYFLLRREQDVLQKLLSSTPTAGSNSNKNNNNGCDGDDDEGNDGNSNNNVLLTGTMNSNKKRKRE